MRAVGWRRRRRGVLIFPFLFAGPRHTASTVWLRRLWLRRNVISLATLSIHMPRRWRRDPGTRLLSSDTRRRTHRRCPRTSAPNTPPLHSGNILSAARTGQRAHGGCSGTPRIVKFASGTRLDIDCKYSRTQLKSTRLPCPTNPFFDPQASQFLIMRCSVHPP